MVPYKASRGFRFPPNIGLKSDVDAQMAAAVDFGRSASFASATVVMMPLVHPMMGACQQSWPLKGWGPLTIEAGTAGLGKVQRLFPEIAKSGWCPRTSYVSFWESGMQWLADPVQGMEA
jgi:hypothetical protein